MKQFSQIIVLILITLTSGVVAEEQQTKTAKAQGGTGFKINFTRTFEFTEDTVFKEDGETIPEINAQGGTGYKIRYALNGQVNAGITEGAVAEADLINVLKGPITSLDPLTVFNTEVQVTANTFFPDLAGLAGFQLTDTIKASGFVANDSNVLATRMADLDDTADWKISGYAEQVSNGQFAINGQLIDYLQGDLQNCGAALLDGDFVEVLASPILGFVQGQTLSTVLSVTCVSRSVLPDGVGDLQVAVEGMIDEVGLDGDFVLAGQVVDVDNSTTYIRGKATDIQERIKVEVEGEVSGTTGAITADKIRFLEPRFSLVIPVTPADVFSADEINVAGVSVFITPQTQDPDMILDNGIIQPTQIKFMGYVDSDLNLYATLIEDKGNADYNDVSINGEINDINQPLIELLGIEIDTTGSQFFDADNLPITAQAFFAQVAVGNEIEIEQAVYNPNNQRFELGMVSIEQSDNGGKKILSLSNKAGVIEARGVGTITGFTDPIFSNSFE